jgi:hypothetical protein
MLRGAKFIFTYSPHIADARGRYHIMRWTKRICRFGSLASTELSSKPIGHLG